MVLEYVLNRQEFLSCLNSVSVCAGKNRTMPSLDWCKLDFNHISGYVALSCTDLDCFITKECRFDNVMSGSCSFGVDAADLQRVLGSISTPTVTFFVDEEKLTLKLYYGSGEMCLPIHDVTNFPCAKRKETIYELSLPTELLAKWLNTARSYVANDKLRPVLCGVYFYSQFGTFGCCATDGKSLFTDSMVYNSDDFDGEEKGFVLPTTSIRPVLATFGSHESIILRVDDSNVTFSADDNSEVICRLPVGKYPNFRSILPKDYNKYVSINKELLSSAISRCMLCANDASKMVSLSIKDDKIIVSSESIEFNKSAKEDCPIENTNMDEFRIGVKADTLVSCLNTMESDVVSLYFAEPNKPIDFVEDLKESLASNKRVICMPLQL